MLTTIVAIFAWFIPTFILGLFTPIKSALVTVNNITEESGDVVRTAAHLVGGQLKKTILALGEDEQQIQETVLHVTKVASILATKHLNRTTAPVLSAANGVSVMTGDFLEFASNEIRQACWLVACLFLTTEKCNEQFYTEFHLCDKPMHNITEDGKSYLVSAPCQYHGTFITTSATDQYNSYVRDRVFTGVDKGFATLKDTGELNPQSFNALAHRYNLYEHMKDIADEECLPLKQYMQADCYARHCVETKKVNISPDKLSYACLYDNYKKGYGVLHNKL